MGHKKRAFIGFDYIPHFRELLGNQLGSWVSLNRVEPVFPLDKPAGGDLLARIESMISGSDFTICDCTTLNPNVTFELGLAIGKRMPFFVLYESSFTKARPMPPILKTQWGLWYESFGDLKEKLKAILLRSFPKGTYDIQTNQLILPSNHPSIELTTVYVFVDKTTDYSSELQIIKDIWSGNKIVPVDIADYNNLPDLFASIEIMPIAIGILQPRPDEDESSTSSTINEINALKLLAIGIASGLERRVLLLQQGVRDYSDVVGLSRHWRSHEELRQVLKQWNVHISSMAINRAAFRRSTGIPNFGKLVKRKRLNSFISSNLFSKTVLIRTPSGYGKSSLVAQFVSENQYPVIWYTVNAELIGAADLVRDIVSRLNSLDSKVGRDLASVISAFSKHELTVDSLISYLSSELELFDGQIILVIDDAHQAIEAQLLGQIKSLINGLPRNVGLIVLSREDLGDEVRHLDGKRIVELKRDELRFNKEEISDYVNTIFGLSLTTNDLELLWEKSEGWIASISLLNSVIAQQGKEAIPEIISRLRGTDVKIYDYFASIVYDGFDKKAKHFLDKTSILNNLTAPTVSFLMNGLEAEVSTTLREFERRNSFLFNFNNEPDVYRYHSLFKEFLQNKYMIRVGAEEIKRSKASLSQFYLTKGEYIEAISFGLESEYYESVTKAITEVGHYFVNEGLGRVLLAWLQQIPKSHYEMDYRILMLRGRAEEQIGEVNSARSSFLLAQTTMLSEGAGERDKILLRLLIHDIDMVQETDVVKLQQESLDIMVSAKKVGEDAAYYGAAAAYFSRMGERMAKEQKAGEIDTTAYERAIEHIDSVLKELSDSTIIDKGIYVSQLLISKAKIVHFVSRVIAARALTRNEITYDINLKPDLERARQELSEFRKADRLQMDCLDEALTIAKKGNMLLLEANFLAERAELASSNCHYMALMFSVPPQQFIEGIMQDFNKALEIYSKLEYAYGIAMVYNNVASSFLLINDKANRDKYAGLSLELSRKHSFEVLEKKSTEIMSMPTLVETKAESVRQVEQIMKGPLPERERDQLIESMLDLAGEMSPAEKERRRAILLLEIRDMEDHRAIRGDWCKHLEMFDTRNPLSKHPRLDESMVRAYLQKDEEAIRLYDSVKDDFGRERLAKFLFCRQRLVHSDELGESVKSLADNFKAKHCVNCRLRET